MARFFIYANLTEVGIFLKAWHENVFCCSRYFVCATRWCVVLDDLQRAYSALSQEKRWAVLGGGLAAVLVVFFLLFGRNYFRGIEVEDEPPALVEAERVRAGTIGRVYTTNGTLRPSDMVVLFPESDGRVSDIFFEQGKPVEKGETLLRLDDQLARAEVERNRASLDVARNEYERARKLFEKNFAPQSVLDEKKSRMEVAAATLKMAQVRLEQTFVRAPFDGIVGLRNVSVGTTIARNQNLGTILVADPLNVDFFVPDTHVSMISVGDVVDVTVEGYDSLPMEARIVAVDSQANPGTHSIQVRAELPNESGAIKPGQFARVAVNLGSENDALLVPVAAVDMIKDRPFIYTVMDHTAVRTEVTLGVREGGVVHVKSGIKEGVLVITAGKEKVRDGQVVRVAQEQEQEKSA
jgi:membrane fusion protein (multidrug efflux system)